MTRTNLAEFDLKPGPPESAKVDLLAIGVNQGALDCDAIKKLDQALKGEAGREIALRGFDGRAGAEMVLPAYGAIAARNVLLFGLGSDPQTQALRLLGEAAVHNAHLVRARSVAIDARGLDVRYISAIAEGAELGAYRFKEYKGSASTTETLLRMSLVSHGGAAQRAVEDGRRMAAATNFARDLINTPADDATPQFLAERACAMAEENGLECEVSDRAGIERLKMGALLGVAKASPREPRFIELRYRPQQSSSGHVALVGKGITFDSGGLSLKGPAAMEEQKRDMTGAALMLGVMSQIAYFRPPIEVRAYLPCTENMIGSNAIKPGDVLRTRSGQTVEVLNTDAEGRLVLADAIAYACESSPRCVIDAGTLTAAVRAALGTRVAAILGNDPALVRRIRDAGTAAGESFWELPLVTDYAEELKSNVADLRNVGTSGNAGTIICALFLHEFVKCPSWAHLDLSGVAFTNKAIPLSPPGAVGFGVRTLLRYVSETV
ncbi:MAG TPA: leucyl aminopeptidase [Candidatus Binataceae bacterium]|nr:leucyl aminopeptidase [Candidatus Binataceae bacterium]